MRMECSQIDELVQMYLDRELPAERQQALRSHLQACDGCRAAYQPLLEAIDAAERAPIPAVPAGLPDRVLAALPDASSAVARPTNQPGQQIRRARRMAVWLRSSAALAATLLLATWVLRSASIPGGSEPQGRTPVQMAGRHTDRHTALWLAVGTGTAPVSGGTASLALAVGQVAAAGRTMIEPEPLRVAVCMALPPGSEDPERLVPAVADVLGIISKQTALPGGF